MKIARKIENLKDEAISKGFDWPTVSMGYEDASEELLEEFYEEILQFLEDEDEAKDNYDEK